MVEHETPATVGFNCHQLTDFRPTSPGVQSSCCGSSVYELDLNDNKNLEARLVVDVFSAPLVGSGDDVPASQGGCEEEHRTQEGYTADPLVISTRQDWDSANCSCGFADDSTLAPTLDTGTMSLMTVETGTLNYAGQDARAPPVHSENDDYT